MRLPQLQPRPGAVAKWLGNGLQNRDTSVRIRSAPQLLLLLASLLLSSRNRRAQRVTIQSPSKSVVLLTA